MNLGQQIGGQMVNPMFHGDRAPQRHVEAYQQVLDPQPPHQQDTNAYWADKIAEVMRDQFGIKPKVNTYSYCGGINPYTLTARLGPGGLAHYETSSRFDPIARSFVQGNKTWRSNRILVG